jgi:VWFA-related protein
MGALQQFTTDKRLLHRAVDKLRRHQCSRMGWSVLSPVGTLVSNEISLCSRGSEGLSARALGFVVQGMGDLPGRKAMVVFSDNLPLSYLSLQATNEPGGGSDGVSREAPAVSNDPSPGLSLESALMRIAERAIRASVVIYGVDTSGIQPIGITAADNFPSMGGPGSGVTPESVVRGRSHQLQDARGGSELIAKETGGFLVRNSNDFQLQRVMKDQEGYYLIGYRPTEETFNRRFHYIKARVKRPGAAVRTREGFFGVTDAEAQPKRTTRDKINVALMSPFATADVDVELTALFANTAANGNELHSFLYFQARDLTFSEEADGWRQAVFDLSGIIFGDNGAIAHQVSETRTLRLRRNAYDQVLRRGLVYRLVLPVPNPGSYQFRVAIRDAGTSRIGTAGQFVEVPNLKNDKLALSGITVSGYLDSNDATGQQPSAVTLTDRDAMSGPSRRKFQTPSNLYYGYFIYNPQLDKAARQPKLMTTMRIIREGKVVFEGQPTPLDLTGQTDPQRIIAGSGVQLGTEMISGEYVLQVTVTDLLAKDKQATATQWIDFEIVK